MRTTMFVLVLGLAFCAPLISNHNAKFDTPAAISDNSAFTAPFAIAPQAVAYDFAIYTNNQHDGGIVAPLGTTTARTFSVGADTPRIAFGVQKRPRSALTYSNVIRPFRHSFGLS